MMKFVPVLLALSNLAFADGRIRNSNIADDAAISPSKIAVGNWAGNAATASAFDHVPTPCSGSQVGVGQNANGSFICATVSSLPSQTGNSGKYLTTDGSTASWAARANVSVGTGLDITAGSGTNASFVAFTVGIAAGFYLPSTADQTNWNAKQAAITTGTTAQYLKGDLSLGTFNTSIDSYVGSPTAPILYSSGVFSCRAGSTSQSGCISSTDWNTFNGKESVLTFNAPLSRTVNAISCIVATGSVAGCLSSTDWNTFNGKQAAGNYITALTGDGTLSGFSGGSAALTLKNTGPGAGSYTNSNITIDAQGRVTAAASGSAGAGTATTTLSKTSSYALLVGDFDTSALRVFVKCACTSECTITLVAASNTGYSARVENTGTAICHVKTAGSDTMQGFSQETTWDLYPSTLPRDYVILNADGSTSWF